MKHREYELQVSVCNYLRVAYPKALFMSDTIANVRLTIPQQVRNKKIQKKGFACPDLLILEPNGIHCGLFIELKTKSPYKKNGELYKNEHLENQQDTINDLIMRGYSAQFCWSLDQAIKIIDEYFSHVIK